MSFLQQNQQNSNMESQFDDVLFEVLKSCKNLPNFFDAIFGFLNRRTDFYYESDDPNLQVGFPSGLTECLLRQSFMKWQNVSKERHNPTPPLEIDADLNHIEYAPDILEVCTETVEVDECAVNNIEMPTSCVFDSSDYYNGAYYVDYAWSQSITDVDIKVLLPDGIVTKNLNVDITANKVLVQIVSPEIKVLLEGELCKKCKATETLWSIDIHKSRLEIHLEKEIEMWWDKLVSTEPKLDFNKMDCSRPFHELSDEAQAKIEELTWNQEQKRLGKPTSDEINMEKTFKTAWNVEGSPFQGEYSSENVIMQ